MSVAHNGGKTTQNNN